MCEEGPAIGSKIKCYDSPLGNSRYCIFENAMMNFKKMRKVSKQDGTNSRQWERGFLSADCGYEGKDDIGYLQVNYYHYHDSTYYYHSRYISLI